MKETDRGGDGLRRRLAAIVLDEMRRIRMQYLCVYVMLATVSLFMTVLNLFTHKGVLTWATLIFCLLCLANLALLRWFGQKGLKLSSRLFMLELMVLFIFFIVSGNPEGFSCLWIILLPACGALLFGLKPAIALCLVMLFILVFFFWTPVGQSFLPPNVYTETFMMRFPILYVASAVISCILELIRSATQRELIRTRSHYEHLYSRDALTSLLNRHGLYEWRGSIQVHTRQTVMMFDLDHFKRVNDTYGHDVGDLVLAGVAAEVSRLVDTKLCRWGGEEFVAWFPRGNQNQDSAERIRRAVERLEIAVPHSDEALRVTISIGVAHGGPDTPLDSLIKEADKCLYQAKADGRNRVVFQEQDV